MSQTKTALRLQAKETRSLLSPTQIATLSRIIERRLLDLVNGFETIMVYVSKTPEVETECLITDLNRRGVRVVVPIIERETTSLRLSYLPDPRSFARARSTCPNLWDTNSRPGPKTFRLSSYRWLLSMPKETGSATVPATTTVFSAGIHTQSRSA